MKHSKFLCVFACFGASVLGAPDGGHVSGVPKFSRVDEHVYRGGQPKSDGFRSLQKRGIRTVVDLRSTEDQARRERQEVEALGMRYVHVPMRPNVAPTSAEVSRALSVLNDPNAWPVFVHCDGGVDRTGVVTACYRVGHDHWTREKALAEARRKGMHHDRHEMQAFIASYQPSDAAPSSGRAGAEHARGTAK